jgi:hypothetical protein
MNLDRIPFGLGVPPENPLLSQKTREMGHPGPQIVSPTPLRRGLRKTL